MPRGTCARSGSDLRAATFEPGHTAKTLLGHMTASVTRTGANAFEIMVFRSMAETLVEELTRAANAVAARG
jgi:sarcosine oxidase subunit gamma